MQHPKWFVLISVLGLIGVAVGWLTASEVMIPGAEPTLSEAAATPTAVPAGDRIPTQPDTLSAPVVAQTQPVSPPQIPEPYRPEVQIETPPQAASPQPSPVPTPAAQSPGFQTAVPSPVWTSEPATAQLATPPQAQSPQPIPIPAPTANNSGFQTAVPSPDGTSEPATAQIETPAQTASPQPVPVPTPAAQSPGFQTAAPSPDWTSEPVTAQVAGPERPAGLEPVSGPPPVKVNTLPEPATPHAGPAQEPAATPRETSGSPAAAPEKQQALQGPTGRESPYRQRTPVDAYGVPQRYMPPWFAEYDDAVERHRDARRSHYRKQRDLRRQRRESRLDALCPWPKPQREWPAQRNARRQMERLERRAYRDSFMNRPPYGFGGPGGW